MPMYFRKNFPYIGQKLLLKFSRNIADMSWEYSIKPTTFHLCVTFLGITWKTACPFGWLGPVTLSAVGILYATFPGAVSYTTVSATTATQFMDGTAITASFSAYNTHSSIAESEYNPFMC